MMNEEAAPRTSAGKRVLTYAATLVVAAVAIYGLSVFLTPIHPPKQGDCAFLTGDIGRYEAVDCSGNANYLIEGTVATSQSCPNGEDSTWVPVRRIDPKIRFCLAPLYDEGECYPEDRSGYDINAVDCSDENVFKVLSVSRNVPAPACAAGERPRAYPAVKLTYCLGRG
ncbi:hypothetical protein ABZ345_43510 [Lentzea sp. NPDC005914]|uniref:hypothetical protein n=1 Tax=Lentzea sp. NPDC005914 TaxID=3154572 RepID=UPI00340DD3D6